MIYLRISQLAADLHSAVAELDFAFICILFDKYIGLKEVRNWQEVGLKE